MFLPTELQAYIFTKKSYEYRMFFCSCYLSHDMENNVKIILDLD